MSGPGHLAAFAAQARHDVDAGRYTTTASPAGRKGPSLVAALRRGDAIVAELKRASPSEGPLLRGAASSYIEEVRHAGAAALSIVTAGGAFAGDPSLLQEAATSPLPRLMKDFVVDERQVAFAVHAGASAVLLIERLQAPDRREALVREAHDHGLEVLLEVHDQHGAQQARGSRADLLGANTRDLDTLAVDGGAGAALLDALPSDRPRILLSGIATRGDARRAFAAGADALVVGTSLLRAPDARLATRALQRPLAKVCGLRHGADVATAREADLAGIVVLSSSPRDVAPDTAVTLIQQARDQGQRAALVTRSSDADAVLRVADAAHPDFVQVHGAEATRLAAHLTKAGHRVLLGVQPGTTRTPGAKAAGLVLDSDTEGGSGQPHRWSLAPPGFTLVAGGLDASNVAAALDASRATGADASSRLEDRAGSAKDPVKVRAYLEAVHGA